MSGKPRRVCHCDLCLASKHVAFRSWRRVTYTVVQDLTQVTKVKALSVTAALRMVKLRPGARVMVFIPAIVHQRRLAR